MSRLSASKIDLARRCGWGFRPDVGKPNDGSSYANKGNDEHNYIEATIVTSDETPQSETHKRWLEEWWPRNKELCAWNAERKIALNLVTGETILGPMKSDHRDYGWAPRRWLVGTVDAWAIEDRDGRRVLRIVDWKTGLAAHIKSANDAGQMLFLGLAFYRELSKTESIDAVSLEYVLVNENRLWAPPCEVSRATLAMFQSELAELVDMIDESPEPNPGHWCKSEWCGYHGRCPATSGALARVETGLAASKFEVAFEASEFESDEHAAWQLAVIKAAQARVDAAYAAVKDRARSAPIPVGDGKVYGPREKSRETVDIGSSRAILTLQKHLGRHTEDAYEVKKSSSKTLINKVVGVVAKETGVTQKSLKEALYADMADVGAIKITTYEELTEYAPKGAKGLEETNDDA